MDMKIIPVLDSLTIKKRFDELKPYVDSLKNIDIPYNFRYKVYLAGYLANLHQKNIEECYYWLSKFEFSEISRDLFQESNNLFKVINKQIIASFDSERTSSENEIVIVYGNYPDWHQALPYSSKIFRHVSMFFDIVHDVVEYDPSWEFVDTIYILNMEERYDRFCDTLISLCSVKAPLHRIHHYKAKRDGNPVYVNATRNQVNIIKHFVESGKEHCMILEDDIVFIDDRNKFWNDLSQFSKRKYDYDICFLAISKFGPREELDDLLSRSRQFCTASSSFILQKSTALRVMQTANEGLEKLIQTGLSHLYSIDRYWCNLPNILFFKHKLGYQRPSWSSITNKINFNLD
jgi:hypothetical protein